MIKILLVCDDDNSISRISRPLTATKNFEVIPLRDISLIMALTTSKKYDCLILDISQIGSAAIKPLEQLHEHEKTRGLPILIFTDNRQESVARKALSLGASDYIKKPIFSVTLLKKVNDLVADLTPEVSESKNLSSDSGINPTKYKEGETGILGEIHKSLEKHIGFAKDRQAIIRIHGYASGNDDILRYKDLFAGDVASAIDLFRMANSTVMGARSKVVGFSTMLQRLGSNSVESKFALPNKNKPNTNAKVQTFIHDHFRFHSILTACLAEEISIQTSKGNHDELFTAALFHDIGKLYFITYYPDIYGDIITAMWNKSDQLMAAEKEAFSIDHAELGVLIFRSLGFARITQEVCVHRKIPDNQKQNFQNPNSMRIVHLSSELSHLLLDDDGNTDFEDKRNDVIKKIVREMRISVKVVIGNSKRRLEYMAERLHSKLTINPELIEDIYENFGIYEQSARSRKIETSGSSRSA